ncbi:pyridoxamine 5'-phosphate oxidase family protein [Spiribacter halobius]|uniref:Pyridoxamine 5'-phosphate oxidase n=1 Tax=Sediminicurvatus halobius TaxID=2182432 RepID=A0A2U2N2R0_9GAMM|nr:pyridoxamine 5'-phosphate oxidase family protein [Spiribacter halobius]PWG63525.1 pyridoxamine 5'-phosphate oxidase [Spiribacter halobius]UEX79601.1 pyridoxamine 5'-phosphate oxidase family protein [Spiribacter halobius]
MTDPYHAGERAVQEAAGERDAALANGRNMNPRIPAAAHGFVAQQQFVLLGGADREGRLWAALIAGAQGFAQVAVAGETLSLQLSDPGAVLPAVEPLRALQAGDHLGVLFIELATRRRLRVNGRVRSVGAGELVLTTDQAYALCPKYIQRRRLEERPAGGVAADVREGERMDGEIRAWIEAADTFFVASAHPDGPADVSHRGGRSGFVEVAEGRLRIPDYPGNSMFNTLGNFTLRPEAGLAFIDFEGNRQLQLTGSVELALDQGDRDGRTGGTGRWWSFRPEAWRIAPLNRAFVWELIDSSPFNP